MNFKAILSICSTKELNKEVFNKLYKKKITKNNPIAIKNSSSQLKKPLPIKTNKNNKI
jgi:hypothetical protein